MKRKNLLSITALIASLIASGCTTTDPSISPNSKNQLTHGQVQLTLKKDVTTQEEVLQAFGAPNVTTIDAEGREVWTYQKHATVVNSSSIGAGAGAGASLGKVILGTGISGSKSGLESSSRTMTLIIKFDNSKHVYDFNSFSSSF